jgi:hypothetical protein
MRKRQGSYLITIISNYQHKGRELLDMSKLAECFHPQLER